MTIKGRTGKKWKRESQVLKIRQKKWIPQSENIKYKKVGKKYPGNMEQCEKNKFVNNRIEEG